MSQGRIIRLRRRFGPYLGVIWGIAALSLIFMLGVAAFMLVEGWKFFDSLYMVVITLSTVGYGEVLPLSTDGRIVAMLLILSGVGTFFYLIGAFTKMLVEGNLHMFLGRRKVRKQIEKMHGHVIVCGYGRLGRVVVADFLKEGIGVVVVEREPEVVSQLQEREIPHIDGDATDDETLAAAGIGRARALAACLTQEAANVYVTLTARQLAPDLYIVARADEPRHIQRLERAGANQALIPHLYGGHRMAQSILRPSVVNFLEIAIRGDDLGLQMEELKIGPNSRLAGKNLADSPIRADFDLIVIAIIKTGGTMNFNPGHATVLENGDTLILVGSREHLSSLEALL
ncbi:MAG: potassium channel protein [Desulfovibrionaceae bacterium]|nr:potassium channel protein [Desulfovibrionaceae bacterium]MBF0514656.1 potassium channel protein [Desulfovibrionaceae bacterium]